jgi:hypothetical protein
MCFHRKKIGLSSLLRNVILIALTVFSFSANAQEEEENESESFARHRITLMMANSHIPAADNVNGDRFVFIVPTWGFNYDYWFSRRFGLGLHNDIVLQKYKIEDHADERIIERSFPVTVNAVGLFKATEKWIFAAGLGREFEKNESFNMFLLGTEYGIELPNDWELNFNLNYENKWEVYDSWIFGIGFSKKLK